MATGADGGRSCDHCGHPLTSHRVTRGARKDDVDCEVDACACHFDRRHEP